jgi:hypothetical protein
LKASSRLTEECDAADDLQADVSGCQTLSQCFVPLLFRMIIAKPEDAVAKQ